MNGTSARGEQMERLVDMARETAPYMVIALLGALARVCRYGWRGFGQFCAAVVVAAFSGMLCALALADLGASEGIIAASAGIAGYSGGAVLDTLLGGLIKQIEIKTDTQQDNDSGDGAKQPEEKKEDEP